MSEQDGVCKVPGKNLTAPTMIVTIILKFSSGKGSICNAVLKFKKASGNEILNDFWYQVLCPYISHSWVRKNKI